MHALRHCCASLLAAQGVPLRTILEQLRHSQQSLTSDLYVHLAPAMLKDAANALNTALARSKTG